MSYLEGKGLSSSQPATRKISVSPSNYHDCTLTKNGKDPIGFLNVLGIYGDKAHTKAALIPYVDNCVRSGFHTRWSDSENDIVEVMMKGGTALFNTIGIKKDVQGGDNLAISDKTFKDVRM